MTRKRTAIFFFLGGVTCFILAALLVIHFSGRFDNSGPTTMAGPMIEDVKSPVSSIEEKSDDHVQADIQPNWVIYITGSVKVPGVYEIAPESRVYQAVDKAGGFTSEADPVAINLALPLSDGMHVHVPARGEDGVLKPASPAPAGQEGSSSSAFSDSSGQRININGADRTELQTLKGIGPKTADSIISYREENGAFRCVEELLKVKGIGPKKLDALRDCVICSPR